MNIHNIVLRLKKIKTVIGIMYIYIFLNIILLDLKITIEIPQNH